MNKALEHVGSQERVDYRSFKDQGIEKEPTIHEGAAVRKMKSKGIETEKGAYNRRVEANNKMLELIDRQITALEKQKGVLEHGYFCPSPRKGALSNCNHLTSVLLGF